MSCFKYICSDKPLAALDLTGAEHLTMDEMEARGIPMPSWYCPIKTWKPPSEYSEPNPNDPFVFTSTSDKTILYYPEPDNMNNLQIAESWNPASSKPHIAEILWHYSEGQARELIRYIQEHFESEDVCEIELWSCWLQGGPNEWEILQAPNTKQICIADLTVDDIADFEQYHLDDRPRRLIVTRVAPTLDASRQNRLS